MVGTRDKLLIIGVAALLMGAGWTFVPADFGKRRDNTDPAPKAPGFAARNRFAENVPALPEPARRDLFGGLLAASGEKCSEVRKTQFLGTRDGMAYWNVRCTGSGDWFVQIKNDSSATVVSCAELKKVNGRCWRSIDRE
ncbi:MAG: hypothetical protein B7Y45_06655 [Sphingomonas sp. 28-66-16]|nr:MAG: hypothetical protein B7Y45_06655 [Sphingomonas sp. 28-66-16]